MAMGHKPTDAELAYIERLVNDPEWIRQVKESDRRWNRQMAGIMEGDEAEAAEFRADSLTADEFRARYLG